MRNLVQYPITYDEIIECLTEASEDASRMGLIGDMRPLLLKYAADIVRQVPNLHDQLLTLMERSAVNPFDVRNIPDSAENKSS